jgi:hypothetical protein
MATPEEIRRLVYLDETAAPTGRAGWYYYPVGGISDPVHVAEISEQLAGLLADYSLRTYQGSTMVLVNNQGQSVPVDQVLGDVDLTKLYEVYEGGDRGVGLGVGTVYDYVPDALKQWNNGIPPPPRTNPDGTITTYRWQVDRMMPPYGGVWVENAPYKPQADEQTAFTWDVEEAESRVREAVKVTGVAHTLALHPQYGYYPEEVDPTSRPLSQPNYLTIKGDRWVETSRGSFHRLDPPQLTQPNIVTADDGSMWAQTTVGGGWLPYTPPEERDPVQEMIDRFVRENGYTYAETQAALQDKLDRGDGDSGTVMAAMERLREMEEAAEAAVTEDRTIADIINPYIQAAGGDARIALALAQKDPNAGKAVEYLQVRVDEQKRIETEAQAQPIGPDGRPIKTDLYGGFGTSREQKLAQTMYPWLFAQRGGTPTGGAPPAVGAVFGAGGDTPLGAGEYPTSDWLNEALNTSGQGQGTIGDPRYKAQQANAAKGAALAKQQNDLRAQIDALLDDDTLTPEERDAQLGVLREQLATVEAGIESATWAHDIRKLAFTETPPTTSENREMPRPLNPQLWGSMAPSEQQALAAHVETKVGIPWEDYVYHSFRQAPRGSLATRPLRSSRPWMGV